MSNTLINLDLAKMASESQEKADKLKAIAITPSNCIYNEEIRTEANKEIKAIKNNIEEAKKAFLAPFTKVELQALEAIKPYEEATKEFSSKLLEAKKERRRQKLLKTYRALIAPNEDGELPYAKIPPFEECIEGIALSVSESLAETIIRQRLANAQKTVALVSLVGSKTALRELKEKAKELGIEWENID